MVQSTKEFVTVNGCKVEVMRGGKGSPVMFLHGAGGGGIWMPFMDKIAAEHEVIVPSHPGYDNSDTPEWLDNVGDVAFFYLDFLEKLGLKDIDLIGNSMGGWIAAEIAVRDQKRLKTLTLISAAGIHVNGVAKGDLFLWTPEQRVRALFHDQKFAEQLLSIPPTPEMIDTQLKNSFITAKLAWSPRFYNPRPRQVAASDQDPDADRVGRRRQDLPRALRQGVRRSDPGLQGRGHPQLRARAAGGEARRVPAHLRQAHERR